MAGFEAVKTSEALVQRMIALQKIDVK